MIRNIRLISKTSWKGNDRKRHRKKARERERREKNQSQSDCFVNTHIGCNNNDTEIDTELEKTNYTRFYLDSMTAAFTTATIIIMKKGNEMKNIG